MKIYHTANIFSLFHSRTFRKHGFRRVYSTFVDFIEHSYCKLSNRIATLRIICTIHECTFIRTWITTNKKNGSTSIYLNEIFVFCYFWFRIMYMLLRKLTNFSYYLHYAAFVCTIDCVHFLNLSLRIRIEICNHFDSSDESYSTHAHFVNMEFADCTALLLIV